MPVQQELQLGIYIHIPFCLKRCAYCDFTMIPYTAQREAQFLTAIKREAALLSGSPCAKGRRPVTLYAGGGTPSALTPEGIGALFEIMQQNFDLTDVTEVTIEVNPETATRDRLEAFKRGGATRLSIGFQAWDDQLLRVIGRDHTVDDFLKAWQTARNLGFSNLNLDLIYGLPGQTPGSWHETLLRAVSLEPQHISAYGLQVEEGTALKRWIESGRLSPAGEDLSAEMYEQCIETLVSCGFEHYEISNFAMPGYRSRHNLLYWDNQEYLGLGPGAHSHCGQRRWENTGRLDVYEKSLAQGRLPVENEEELDRRREMSDTVILGLRKIEGLSLDHFRQRFGQCVQNVYRVELEGLIRERLLEVTPTHLRLTGKGLPLANLVFAAFV